MNIKEIAKRAGVSIATVSHVVNKTRYVSSELTERVLQVIEESDDKPGFLLRNLKSLKSDVILCLADNVTDYFYADMIQGIQRRAAQDGHKVVVLCTQNTGLIHEYVKLEKPAGLIVLADRLGREELHKFKDLGLPTIVAGRNDRVEGASNVVYDPYETAYKGTHHLIKSGHDRICFLHDSLLEQDNLPLLAGYRDALENSGLSFEPSLVIGCGDDPGTAIHALEKLIHQETKPTGFVSADENTTIALLKFFYSNNLKCPDDVSFVCLHEFRMSHMMNPAVTTVVHDPGEIGAASVEKLEALWKNTGQLAESTVIPSRITVRNSTQCIARGPLGEKAESPEALELSPSEIEMLKAGSYTAAISFHYSGTAWARLHEKGIKDVFSEFGVKVLVVTDAHFDPELQNKQHDSILRMNPNVLISIPADTIATVPSYKEIVNAGVKLVLINNVPHGFERDDYVTCISVNERENGQIAGRLLGEHLRRSGKKNIGLLMHGSAFFNTNQRDMAVEQVLTEEFPDLAIAAVETFGHESKAMEACRSLIRNHPELEGLYISWEGPAASAITVLREMNREDIAIVTADLDTNVAISMAMGGPIKGISAQRPYDQGRALAMAAANALLGKSVPSYIGVSPYQVTPENLLIRWQDILRERAPTSLAAALKGNKKILTAGLYRS